MLDIEKARIKWHCKRGMLELDLILGPYFEQYCHVLTPAECQQFQRLLTYSDPEIYAWLLGLETVQDEELLFIVRQIQIRMLSKTY